MTTNVTAIAANPAVDVLSEQVQQAIYQKLAANLGIKLNQMMAFVKLYDDGATIPFIARYRKDQTGGLDDVQLRSLENRSAMNEIWPFAAKNHWAVDFTK